MEELKKILSKEEINEVNNWKNSDFSYDLLIENNTIYEKLFDRYVNEMPYGTAKARTGDPFTWLEYKLYEILKRG